MMQRVGLVWCPPRLEPRAKCRLVRSGMGGQPSVCFAFLIGVSDVCCNRRRASPVATIHSFPQLLCT